MKTGQRSLFTSEDKAMMRVDISRAKEFLGLERVSSPAEAINRIVKKELGGDVARRTCVSA